MKKRHRERTDTKKRGATGTVVSRTPTSCQIILFFSRERNSIQILYLFNKDNNIKCQSSSPFLCESWWPKFFPLTSDVQFNRIKSHKSVLGLPAQTVERCNFRFTEGFVLAIKWAIKGWPYATFASRTFLRRNFRRKFRHWESIAVERQLAEQPNSSNQFRCKPNSSNAFGQKSSWLKVNFILGSTAFHYRTISSSKRLWSNKLSLKINVFDSRKSNNYIDYALYSFRRHIISGQAEQGLLSHFCP